MRYFIPVFLIICMFSIGANAETVWQGEVAQSIESGLERQFTKFNRLSDGTIDEIPKTKYQLFVMRYENGRCLVKSQGHLNGTYGRTIQMWIKVESEDVNYSTNVEMEARYLYGSVYTAEVDCPETKEFQAEFAFDMGDGRWMNNHGHNYKVSFPAFEL